MDSLVNLVKEEEAKRGRSYTHDEYTDVAVEMLCCHYESQLYLGPSLSDTLNGDDEKLSVVWAVSRSQKAWPNLLPIAAPEHPCALSASLA